MSGEIIRMGDPTSHGGTVLEGSTADICLGKPIAYVGHKTACPKCKGTYAIIEGALTTTFYGKGVALAGMKTACGATLIATQFTDVVEYGQPAASSPDHIHRGPHVATVASMIGAASSFTPPKVSGTIAKFDLFFLVKSEKTGAFLCDTPYRITLEDGRRFRGVTDHAGCTEKVFANSPQKATIEVPYYDDYDINSGSQSDTCGC